MPAPIDPAERKRRKTAFREAVHQLQALGVTIQEVADAFNKTRVLIQYWMQEEERRQPPADWRGVLAVLARSTADDRIAAAALEARSLRDFATKQDDDQNGGSGPSSTS